MEHTELIKIAQSVLSKAYVPYSNFKVGAALITDSGKVFTGVNIENVSYGASVCAERTAIFKAISEGEKKIKAIAIVSNGDGTILPCGMCRQVMAEFGDNETKVICTKSNGSFEVFSLADLLPNAFKSF